MEGREITEAVRPNWSVLVQMSPAGEALDYYSEGGVGGADDLPGSCWWRRLRRSNDSADDDHGQMKR